MNNIAPFKIRNNIKISEIIILLRNPELCNRTGKIKELERKKNIFYDFSNEKSLELLRQFILQGCWKKINN